MAQNHQLLTHHAAGVGLAHRVGVAKGEAGALRGGGVTEWLEQAAALRLCRLTEQTARGCAEPTGGCSWRDTRHTRVTSTEPV